MKSKVLAEGFGYQSRSRALSLSHGPVMLLIREARLALPENASDAGSVERCGPPVNPRIELRVLGRTEVARVAADAETEPQPVALQPKRFALLVYLALARPRGFQRRDSLLVLFWPGASETNARNALNQALYSLRTTLGEDVIESRGRGEVGIAHDRLWCDAAAFDVAMTEHRYSDAAGLYGGEFLTGFHIDSAPGYERWQEAERPRFRRQARAAATAAADREEGSGNLVGAVRWLERAVQISPTDESTVQRLITLLDRTGDRSGAVHVYEQLASNLHTRYGVEPSPETRELIASVRDRDEPHEDTRIPDPRAEASPHAPVRSVAVLPLIDLRDEPDQRFFVDGLTEALIGELARSTSLRVISRQSVVGFRGSDRPLSEIGMALGVDALVEGSVLRVKDRVRLSLQLVRARPEEHLWAEAFERDLSDVLALHREVARAVAEQVEGTVASSEEPQTRKMKPAAYDAFVRGVALLTRGRGEDYKAALEHLQIAVAQDPEFAEPLAWIVLAYGNMTAGGLVSPEEARGPMRDAARQALELDPDLGPAHGARAVTLQLFDRDWKGARDAYRKAAAAEGGIAHDPWKGWLIFFLVGQGRFEKGLSLALQECRRDPIGPTSWLMGWALHKARRFEESIERLEWTLRAWPEFPWSLPFLAGSYLFAGREAEAARTVRKAVGAAPDLQLFLGYGAATLARAGHDDEARQLTCRLEQMRREAYVDPFNLAVSYAGLGEEDRALKELEALIEQGSAHSWIVAPEPFFDPLRPDPRFKAALERLDLPKLEF